MKKNIALKVLIVLIILLICLISFVGIYQRKGNNMVNIIPQFLLGMNLEGARVVKIAPDTSTKEVIYDKEGKVATDGKNEDGTLKEGYTKKDELVNEEPTLTSENYEAVKKIIEKRLAKIEVEEYIVKQDKQTGVIVLELPEATDTDEVITNLTYVGKFEVQDSETGEVLLDNSFVKSAKAVYGTKDSGTAVYLSIEFNKEGKNKLEEISKTYIETTDAEGKSVTKKVAIKLDGEELITTYFGQSMTNGILQLSIGSVSSDNETISGYLKQASSIATLIDSGKTPVSYKLEDNKYMATSISDNVLKIIICAGITILVVMAIYFILRYRAKGALATISFVGFMATLFITLRYTNVTISLEAIVAMLAIILANVGFLDYILKKMQYTEDTIPTIVKQAYIRFSSILVPLLAIAVVFTFATWLPIKSIGMVMFWGLAIMFSYHYLVTRTLLLDFKKNREE